MSGSYQYEYIKTKNISNSMLLLCSLLSNYNIRWEYKKDNDNSDIGIIIYPSSYIELSICDDLIFKIEKNLNNSINNYLEFYYLYIFKIDRQSCYYQN